jgi:hypothetical protein
MVVFIWVPILLRAAGVAEAVIDVQGRTSVSLPHLLGDED